MSLRDDFVDSLAPTFIVVPVSEGRYLITERSGVPLEHPATLHLDERLFDRYVRWLARKVDQGSISDALGTVWWEIDEELSSVPAPAFVTDLGVRKSLLGRPHWFGVRSPLEPLPTGPKDPNLRWVADPPH